MAESQKPDNSSKPILKPNPKENLYESLNSLSFNQSFTLLINHYKREAITPKAPTRTKDENQ